jgi:hypothetical protein
VPHALFSFTWSSILGANILKAPCSKTQSCVAPLKRDARTTYYRFCCNTVSTLKKINTTKTTCLISPYAILPCYKFSNCLFKNKGNLLMIFWMKFFNQVWLIISTCWWFPLLGISHTVQTPRFAGSILRLLLRTDYLQGRETS